MNGDQLNSNTITLKDVKAIVKNYFKSEQNIIVKNYNINNASDKMLGFLSDYWRLTINVSNETDNKRLHFFIKAVSRINETKAAIVKEHKFFDKELSYYEINNQMMKLIDLKPWCPKMVKNLHDAMVFEDLGFKQYRNLKNKTDKFDELHTIEALDALCRFHSSSIIYEELKSKEIGRSYRLTEDFPQFLDDLGYIPTSLWFKQCVEGSLEAYKIYSKYNKNKVKMDQIEKKWANVWYSVFELQDPDIRKVICHRDLWNNNIMFHYTDLNVLIPDDCVLIDFQATKYHSFIADIMQLLYVNLDKKFREQNLQRYLKYYYDKLETTLKKYGINIDEVISSEKFLAVAEKYKLWGCITRACLVPQISLEEDTLDGLSDDAEKLNDFLLKNKGGHLKAMMATKDSYKEYVLSVFDEIAENYCLQDSSL